MSTTGTPERKKLPRINKGQILRTIESEQLRQHNPFNVGDTVKVHTIVKEGEKERVQIFQGVVIARRGSLVNANFTVRRISYGEGVERVFPLHSPRIAKIEVEREGAPRRAKLYYLRERTGKAALYVKPKNKALRSKEKAALKEEAKKAKAEAAAAAQAADAAPAS
jgi:large subunit ribosomal protein L19